MGRQKLRVKSSAVIKKEEKFENLKGKLFLTHVELQVFETYIRKKTRKSKRFEMNLEESSGIVR